MYAKYSNLIKIIKKLPKWGFPTCIVYCLFISVYGNYITIFFCSNNICGWHPQLGLRDELHFNLTKQYFQKVRLNENVIKINKICKWRRVYISMIILNPSRLNDHVCIVQLSIRWRIYVRPTSHNKLANSKWRKTESGAIVKTQFYELMRTQCVWKTSFKRHHWQRKLT